jgi:hypothetical protein
MKPDRNDEHSEALKARRGVEKLVITDNAQVDPLMADILAGYCKGVAVAAFVANEGAK